MTQLLGIAGVIALSALASESQAAGTPPNLLLILADDLGWGDLRCNNPGSRIPTPYLDRLARDGTRFTDAHSSSGVCVPSRFSLLTGRHAVRLVNPPHPEPEFRRKYGGLQPTTPLIPTDAPTLPGVLAQAGYATAMVGKWHLGFDDLLRHPDRRLRGGPIDRGFGRFFGLPSSLDVGPYLFIQGDQVVAQATEPMPAHSSADWPDPRMGEFWREDLAAPGFRHVDVLPELTRQAVAEVRRLAGEGKPFFLYLALPSPHSPLVPSADARGRSGVGTYGDYVSQTDATVGRVLEALDDSGAAGETLVLATSDNGPFWFPGNVQQTGHTAAGPWRGMKGDAWEGGHRVPLLARWPGRVPAGAVSDALVSLTDLPATVSAAPGSSAGRVSGRLGGLLAGSDRPKVGPADRSPSEGPILGRGERAPRRPLEVDRPARLRRVQRAHRGDPDGRRPGGPTLRPGGRPWGNSEPRRDRGRPGRPDEGDGGGEGDARGAGPDPSAPCSLRPRGGPRRRGRGERQANQPFSGRPSIPAAVGDQALGEPEPDRRAARRRESRVVPPRGDRRGIGRGRDAGGEA